MKLGEAQMLVESGAVDSAIIFGSETEPGWILKITIDKRNVSFPLELQAERGPIRIFKSVDAAVRSAKKIGLSNVVVILKK
jgi:hypothetical protein